MSLTLFTTLLTVMAVLFPSCTMVRRVPSVPIEFARVQSIDVREKLPISVGILIPDEAKDATARYETSLFSTKVIYETKPGEAVEKASIDAFSQVFQEVKVIRNLEDAKSCALYLEPRVESVKIIPGAYWFLSAYYVKTRVRVIAHSGSLEVWNESLQNRGRSKPWFWQPNRRSLGEVIASTLSKCLEELAGFMARDPRIQVLGRQVR